MSPKLFNQSLKMNFNLWFVIISWLLSSNDVWLATRRYWVNVGITEPYKHKNIISISVFLLFIELTVSIFICRSTEVSIFIYGSTEIFIYRSTEVSIFIYRSTEVSIFIYGSTEIFIYRSTEVSIFIYV